jgi:hypothetical protein
MMLDRRGVLLGLAGSALVGGAVHATEKPFIIEEFFAGRTIGKGCFSVPLAGIKRELTVYTRGRWNGRTLTLVEDFDYADGERDRKTWRFTKVSPGRYEGTREDVIGKADVRQVGRVLALSYEADVRGKDGSLTRVGFADTIGYKAYGGGVYNIATVTRFGIPIGDVNLIFKRA